MKKFIIPLLFLVLILTCFGCSNNSTSQTTTTQDNTSSSTDSSQNNSSSSSTTGTNTSIVGDWEFKGAIDGTTYDITLDLENDNQFDLNVEEENSNDDVEAEMEGTYTADNGTLTLNVVTLQNNSSYFTGEVVQNAQLELKYTLKDDNTLELTNMNDVIEFIPAELTLTRDF